MQFNPTSPDYRIQNAKLKIMAALRVFIINIKKRAGARHNFSFLILNF
jgi:hypothetical protein